MQNTEWVESGAPLGYKDGENILSLKGSERVVMGEGGGVGVEPSKYRDGWVLGGRVLKKEGKEVIHAGVVRDFCGVGDGVVAVVEVDSSKHCGEGVDVLAAPSDALPSLFNIFQERKYLTSPLNEITGGSTYTTDTIPRTFTTISDSHLCVQINGAPPTPIDVDFTSRTLAVFTPHYILTSKAIYNLDGTITTPTPTLDSSSQIITGKSTSDGGFTLLVGTQFEPVESQNGFMFSPDAVVRHFKKLRWYMLKEKKVKEEDDDVKPQPAMDVNMLLAGIEAMLDKKLKPLEERLEKLEKK